MAQKGYVSIYRSLTKHWLWEEKPFSKGQAWVDLLLLANHKDTKFPYKGEVMNGYRGGVFRSISFLSERWGWSRGKATRFLRQLESDGMIRLSVSIHQTEIRIINYDLYQSGAALNDEASKMARTEDGQLTDNKQTASVQRVDIYNNDNNGDNENNNDLGNGQTSAADEWFDSL